MKRVLAFILALLTILGVLAGCSGGSGGGAGTAGSQGTQPPAGGGAASSDAGGSSQAGGSASQSEELPPIEGEEMWFQNGEKKIYAQMFRPEEEKEKYPTIVLSHGFNGNYADNVERSQMFAREGYIAVVFDYCGGAIRSKSDGDMTEMSVLTEAEDLNCVMDQLLALDYVDPENFFLLGMSQGGFISAYVAAKRPDEVKALGLLFPAFSLQDDCWDRHGSIENIPETEVVMNCRLGAVYSQDAMSFDIYDVIGDYKGDVLICHGDQDEVVDLSYSEKAAEVYENAELKVIKRAGHGFHGKPLEESNGYLVEFFGAHVS